MPSILFPYWFLNPQAYSCLRAFALNTLCLEQSSPVSHSLFPYSIRYLMVFPESSV